MLMALSIQHIALIDTLDLSLKPGLAAFTGETGAGKSIVLDAIGLLLGNRGSADIIRTGFDQARVEAVFDVGGGTAVRIGPLLSEWGMDATEELVVSRELQRSGRNVCRINGRMATVQMLRELGELLVQQHGQHDHQGLLKTDEQLRLLDLYGHHQAWAADVRAAYSAWAAADQAWQAAQIDEQERMRRLDSLSFQIVEIEQAQLVVGEEDDLRHRHRLLQNADKIGQALDEVAAALQGGERQRGVTELLAVAGQHLAVARAHDDRVSTMAELLETAQVHAEESARALHKYMNSMERDPALLEQLDERLAVIRGVQRKYGPTVEAVLAHVEQCRQERDHLDHLEERTAQLSAQRTERLTHLAAVSMRLRAAREEAAHRLAGEIVAVLRHLSMPGSTLEISVAQRTGPDGAPVYGPDGVDVVAFAFSANRGEAPRPLNKVASGGELSRTLLAIKAVLAEVDDVDTLIFDEIDTGVSGTAAQRIAEHLAGLGRRRQVLCVTHAAQLAAAADWQFEISKLERDTDTITKVHLLDGPGRVREVARLLGSGLADETAWPHAAALLDSFGHSV